ncbi:P-loop containing nucleoside triphosphate hydrolase protein [Wallemia mellicola]|nr:P-loop containing nucleoside triphosphate hydrolase protein [Wallemia mellicola]TIC75033.1 P-loop containing nucleoside triphosphate hydrolase protein [Wallemia mellicola]
MTFIYYRLNRSLIASRSIRTYKSAATSGSSEHGFGLRGNGVRTSKHQTREALFNLNSKNRQDSNQKLPSFNKNYVEFTESVKNFTGLTLVDGLLESIQSIIGAKTLPTSIQSLSFMSLLNGRNKQSLLAAETGSGKTFAFLIPLIHSLKSTEGSSKKTKPRAIIVAPTRELCRQLTSQVKALTHNAKLKSTYVHNAEDGPFDNDDVIVGSPEQLLKLDDGFEGVEWLVIDEADALFEKDFIASTESLIETIRRVRGNNVNLVMSTATVNEKFSKYLDETYPKINRLISPKTHTLPRALKVNYAPYVSGNKLADLKNAISDSMYTAGVSNKSRNSKVLVFVNTNDRAEKVCEYFNEKGLKSAVMTSISKGRSKVSNRPIKEFLRNAEHTPDSAQVLVTTSLLARGLDFGTHVQNVFIAEESGSTVDFLHRAGRTGRAGAQGNVTVMVPNKKYQDMTKRRR